MKHTRTEPLVGVLLGEAATSERAASIAEIYRRCPYCGCYASVGSMVIGVFTLPRDHRWWLEWVVERPQETLGLKRAEVFFADSVSVPSPWSQGKVEAKLDQGPCGAGCPDCPRYGEQCDGCPATRWFGS